MLFNQAILYQISSYLLAASRQKPCSSIGDMYPRPVNSLKCYYVRRLSLCCYPFNMQLTLTNLCLSEDKINKLILICRETNFTPGYWNIQGVDVWRWHWIAAAPSKIWVSNCTTRIRIKKSVHWKYDTLIFLMRFTCFTYPVSSVEWFSMCYHSFCQHNTNL